MGTPSKAPSSACDSPFSLRSSIKNSQTVKLIHITYVTIVHVKIKTFYNHLTTIGIYGILL